MKNMVQKTLKLDGLTCAACETRIESKLKKMDGVKEVKVSYVNSMLTITYDTEKTTLGLIKETIEYLDYNILYEATEKEGHIEKKSK